MYRCLTFIVTFCSASIWLLCPSVFAAGKLNDAQINYVLSNSEWEIEKTCGNNTLAPWEGVAKFSNDGTFHADTRCQHTYEPFQAIYKGRWTAESGSLCLHEVVSERPIGSHRKNLFEDDPCFEIRSDRFFFFVKPVDGGQRIQFRPRKHPEHSEYTEMVAALKEVKAARVAAAAADSAMWEEIKYSSQISDFQRYLERYPDGLFVKLAESQIKDLVARANDPNGARDQFAGFDFGNYYALVIGIDNYEHITKLATAVSDAKAIAATLEKDYGFKVTLLLDPRRDDILDAFDDLLETLSDEDNLLIYYAGHGWLDDTTDRGYWLPADAKEGRRSRWLSNADITDTLKSLAAKHVMLVADSCFSGTLTRNAAVGLRDKDYLKRMSKKRARVAMVSGGLEPVADDGGSGHSPFAKAILNALAANTDVVDGTRLFSQVRRPAIVNAQQTPEYSDVRNSGHDGGDFLFVRKR